MTDIIFNIFLLIFKLVSEKDKKSKAMAGVFLIRKRPRKFGSAKVSRSA